MVRVRLSTIIAAVSVAASVILPAQATAEELVFQLPLQGIEIDFDASGEWDRIYATGLQPVEFTDRRGISTAQKIAEQRAKAEIVKFFDQDMSAETIFSELEATSQVSIRREGAGNDGASKESQRTLANSLSEVMRSYSSSNLRGVMILEAGYDEVREEAWVKVGITRTSIAMASSAKGAMTVEPASQQSTISAKTDKSAQGSSSQPSEVRRRSPFP